MQKHRSSFLSFAETAFCAPTQTHPSPIFSIFATATHGCSREHPWHLGLHLWFWSPCKTRWWACRRCHFLCDSFMKCPKLEKERRKKRKKHMYYEWSIINIIVSCKPLVHRVRHVNAILWGGSKSVHLASSDEPMWRAPHCHNSAMAIKSSNWKDFNLEYSRWTSLWRDLSCWFFPLFPSSSQLEDIWGVTPVQ